MVYHSPHARHCFNVLIVALKACTERLHAQLNEIQAALGRRAGRIKDAGKFVATRIDPPTSSSGDACEK